MKEQVLHKLRKVEEQYNVRILFAVESGSRAWGFASKDSDYDIRFVFKRKPKDYLSLWKLKDTIEFMTEDDLDGCGWDLQKAALLLSKSNASFLGWLFSPVIYLENGDTLKRMKNLANENFNPISGFYHYHSMNRAFQDQVEEGNLELKNFFYAARTALCAHWILKFGTIPPVLFRDLYPLIDKESAMQLDALIEEKLVVKEKDQSKIPHNLIELLRTVISENEKDKYLLQGQKANFEAFNQFFLEEVL